MRPQLVALIVAASLTTGWLLASVMSPPVAKLQDLPARAAPRGERGAAEPDVGYAEQLRFRLQAAPPRPQPRRNPFVFADRARATVERGSDAPASSPSFVDAPPAVTAPLPRLSGIGSSQTESGLVRTAIISDGATVHLVKAGELLGGYTVIEVTDDRVVLADAAGQQIVLRLM